MQDRVSHLETGTVKSAHRRRTKQKRMKRSEESLHDLGNPMKCANIRIIGFPEGGKTEKWAECFFKDLIAENVPITLLYR